VLKSRQGKALTKISRSDGPGSPVAGARKNVPPFSSSDQTQPSHVFHHIMGPKSSGHDHPIWILAG